MITKEFHGTTKRGEKAYLYTLTAGSYLATISTYGGTLTALSAPDKNGKVENVVLSYGSLREYEESTTYFGAIIGRVANRIGNAHFILDGVEYSLDKNNGTYHTLHGGFDGFDNRVFEAEIIDEAIEPSLRLSLQSREGDMGFPGTMDVKVTYTLSPKGSLTITYKADVDNKTPINLTNHAYFNLRGKKDILDHLLTLNCDRYLPVNDQLIPTGVVAPVEHTPFDFTQEKPIIKDIALSGGYDHCMVAKEGSNLTTPIAIVVEPKSGRVMKVYTTLEAVQFYSGNFLNGTDKNPEGEGYEKHSGFCLETQHYPDAVNHPHFPSIIYDKERAFEHTTIYSLSVID
ncbi:MAG: galactose mutarotase [Spirochaetia bacterium]|nr:galactose mutarotase [Spirochaetia bacterium]